MNGRELHPGMQHLDGQGVLDYCRQRKGSSDTARADRQQRMLKAIFNQMKSTGQIANIPKIYKAVSDCIETDLSFEQICALSLVAVRMDAEQLDRHMIAGKFASLYSRDVWLVDREKLIELIKDVFNVDAEIAEDVDGEAILAAAAENNAAIQGELYSAALLYNEAKSITSSFKSKLATAIRRECKPYLDQYSISMADALNAAYAELGLQQNAYSMLNSYSGGMDYAGGGTFGWTEDDIGDD